MGRGFWRAGRHALGLVVLLVVAACGGGQPVEGISAKAEATAFKGNGIWWNEREPGSGFFVEAQGSTMVATFFAYEAVGGAPTWYTSSGELRSTAGGLQFSAPLLRYTGGMGMEAPTGDAPRKPTSTLFGAVTISFDGETAHVQLPGRTYEATKFNRQGRVLPATAAQPQTGIWWNPSRDGSGFTVDVADNRATIAVFDYDSSGQPRWRLGTVAVDSQTQPSKASLVWYAEGQALSGAYKAPKVTGSVTANIQFGEPCKAAFSFAVPGYSSTVDMVVSRFAFGSMLDCAGHIATPLVSEEPQLRALLREKSAQGYRPVADKLFRRESQFPIPMPDLVYLDPDASPGAREAVFHAMGARGYRYLTHVDLRRRWATFVQRPAGVVYTYHVTPPPKPVAVNNADIVAEANALGAEGFLHVRGNHLTERVYMKDPQSKARYVYELMPTPANMVAFQAQLQTQGQRGFRFKGDMGGRDYTLLYERDASQSATFSQIVSIDRGQNYARAEEEAARGNLLLGNFYIALGDGYGYYELFFRANNCVGILCEVHQKRW